MFLKGHCKNFIGIPLEVFSESDRLEHSISVYAIRVYYDFHHSKNDLSDEKRDIVLIFFSKHRLWILIEAVLKNIHSLFCELSQCMFRVNIRNPSYM